MKTLVFLHYFGGSGESWKWIVDLMGTKFNCLTLDLPGFGSTAPLTEPSIENYATFISHCLDNKRIKEFILIGHSMGGKLALQMAIDDIAIGKIAQLILISPSPPSVEKMSRKQQNKMRVKPSVLQAFGAVAESTVLKLEGEKLKTAIKTQVQVDDSTRKWWIDEGIHHSIAQSSKRIKIPVTLVIAEKDPAITAQMTFEETLPNLPDGTAIVTHKKCGHLVPLEDPGWLNDVLGELLSKN